MNVTIRTGSEQEKQQLIADYPYTQNVIGENGFFIIAQIESKTVGFLWAFKRQTPAPIDKEELFINVIEVFDTNLRCRGLGTQMLMFIKEIAKREGVYQIRAYCDIRNIPSHKLWVKNGYGINPVVMPDNTIAGSFVSLVL